MSAEISLNAELARLLDEVRHDWKATDEKLGAVKKGRIDILVTEEGQPHVVLECKRGMKRDNVYKRLTAEFRDGTGRPRIVFEVKYDDHATKDTLKHSTLTYCIHRDAGVRFPSNGWLRGSVRDLAAAIQYARIDAMGYMGGVQVLTDAVRTAADAIGKRPAATRKKISEILKQKESSQTWGMAALTVSGAITFHDDAAEHNGARTLNELIEGDVVDYTGLLKTWDAILKIDYFPIFDTARRILGVLTPDVAIPIIQELMRVRDVIISKGLRRSPDLYGQCFQNVIADQEKLAAYYTKPESAALVAALTMPADYPWGDTERVKDIRVADFACGTGALLQAAYRSMSGMYEAASRGSMQDLHGVMMSECLVGADVLPVAAHLTAAGLSGMYPDAEYDSTKIYQPEQGGPNHKIGSLEWISPQATLDYDEHRVTGSGIEGEMIPPLHNSMDVILMNPPYKRSEGPGGRSDQEDVRQIFTAFNAKRRDRTAMGKRASGLYRDGCANKKAGLSTFFMDLAHAKLRGGGRLGLVLPLTAATGPNYEKMRLLLHAKYTDIMVFSIGGTPGESFSADTGMGEIIVSARKLAGGDEPGGRGLFVSLNESPKSALMAMHIGAGARNIRALRLEDGVDGGSSVVVGGEVVGIALDCPTGVPWSVVGTRDMALHQIVYRLQTGSLCLPRAEPLDIGMARLGDLAEMGPGHLKIKGQGARPGMTTSYSGPFDVRDYDDACVYPALWRNNMKTQASMVVRPDKMLERRPGAAEDDVRRVWDGATHVHLNVETRTTSQALLASYTNQRTVGGSAWPSVIIPEQYSKALVVWCNTTLGILCRWAMSNHQQSGRSRSSRTAVEDLYVLDLRSLPMSKLEKFDDVFDRFGRARLGRLANLNRDANRIAMDCAVLEALDLDADLADIRERLAREPSFTGG